MHFPQRYQCIWIQQGAAGKEAGVPLVLPAGRSSAGVPDTFRYTIKPVCREKRTENATWAQSRGQHMFLVSTVHLSLRFLH